MNVHDRLLADYFRWVDHVGLQQAIELPGERFTLASVHRANGKRRKKGKTKRKSTLRRTK